MIRGIMGAVTKQLKEAFGYKVYSDEVARGFQTPCFFITPIPYTERFSKNLVERKLTVVLTFFPEDGKDMVRYAEIYERIADLFRAGVTVGDRFVHTQSISMAFAGETHEEMQVDLQFRYLKTIPRGISGADDAGEVVEDVAVMVETKEGVDR